MERSKYTNAQRAFVDATGRRVAFIGGRQVGHTTALCLDARQRARDGESVAITAPRVEMAWMVMGRLEELLPRGGVAQTSGERDRLVFGGGGEIEVRSVSLFDPHDEPTQGVRLGTAGEEYDHVCIDEFDVIKAHQFDNILMHLANTRTSLSVAGCSVRNSPNISRILEDEFGRGWEIVWDSPRNSELVREQRVNDFEESMTPANATTEVEGMVVIDPRDKADFVNEQELDQGNRDIEFNDG